jgi:DNA-binding NtrC family response regulator
MVHEIYTKRIQAALGRASSSEAHVLILGATGTGKSTLARLIHRQGARRDRPFVHVNLATLHEGTLESELFGHERGAFTGADQRRLGKLELAQGGTVFLDEIAELPLRLQSRLLEVLQSKTIARVGSSQEIQLDVRIIAATHQDLGERVKQGQFREDLFHRLRVLSLRLPSLSECGDEFGVLVEHCLRGAMTRAGRTVTGLKREVAARFEEFPWPGNLRQLSNVLESSLIADSDGVLGEEDLPDWFLEDSEQYRKAAQEGTSTAEIPLVLDYQQALAQFERSFLSWAFIRSRGGVNRTARLIGINKTTLIRRMRLYGIPGGKAAEDFLKKNEKGGCAFLKFRVIPSFHVAAETADGDKAQPVL